MVAKCEKCKEHEGTNKWAGDAGILALSHGWMVEMWCECCCLKAQLKHAQEMAAKIPKLEEELMTAEVVCEMGKVISA